MAKNYVDFSVWPKGKFNAEYAQYFTGNSYLATLEGGLLNVTFEPACRNNCISTIRPCRYLSASLDAVGIRNGARKPSR